MAIRRIDFGGDPNVGGALPGLAAGVTRQIEARQQAGRKSAELEQAARLRQMFPTLGETTQATVAERRFGAGGFEEQAQETSRVKALFNAMSSINQASELGFEDLFGLSDTIKQIQETEGSTGVSKFLSDVREEKKKSTLRTIQQIGKQFGLNINVSEAEPEAKEPKPSAQKQSAEQWLKDNGFSVTPQNISRIKSANPGTFK